MSLINEVEENIKLLSSRLRLEKKKLTYLKDPSRVYKDRFFEKRAGKMRKKQMRVGWHLTRDLKIKSMVDFGCGIGSYIEGAKRAGIDNVLGFELMSDFAIKYASDDIKDYIKQGNLYENIECGKWDCVLSIEVAEHIPKERANIFVDNLTNACNKMIILSASDTYSGTGHFNPQLKDYWISKIEIRGIKYSKDLTNKVCEIWRNAKGESYIISHLMVFEK